MAPRSGYAKPTRCRGGSSLPPGRVRGISSSPLMTRTIPTAWANSSHCVTPRTSSPLSAAGSTTSQSGARILPPRSRGAPAFSRPPPCPVLAFYCIVGGREPLPDFRRELYGRVLNRLLTGRWRGDETRQPDVGACLQTLRAWAWPGPEASHPFSGVGTWTDDILTEPACAGRADQEALDHVAMPLGLPTSTPGRRCAALSTAPSGSTWSPSSLPVFRLARPPKCCYRTCGMTLTGSTRCPRRSPCTLSVTATA